MPTHSVTMTELLSAFFMSGLHKHDVSAVLAKSGNGHVELVLDLCTYTAPLVHMVTAAVLCVGDDPGVLLYEVAEPFGSWFGDVVLRRGRTPDRTLAMRKLQELVIDFYSQGEQCDLARLAAAVGSAQGQNTLH
jgi:hypothetical protein